MYPCPYSVPYAVEREALHLTIHFYGLTSVTSVVASEAKHRAPSIRSSIPPSIMLVLQADHFTLAMTVSLPSQSSIPPHPAYIPSINVETKGQSITSSVPSFRMPSSSSSSSSFIHYYHCMHIKISKSILAWTSHCMSHLHARISPRLLEFRERIDASMRCSCQVSDRSSPCKRDQSHIL